MCDNPGVMAKNFTTTEKFFGLPQGSANKLGMYVSVLVNRDGILEIAEGICADANKDYLVMLPNGKEIHSSFSYVRNARVIPLVSKENPSPVDAIVKALNKDFRAKHIHYAKPLSTPDEYNVFHQSCRSVANALAEVYPDFDRADFMRKIWN